MLPNFRNNGLLQDQIARFLTDEHLKDPCISAFIDVVAATYEQCNEEKGQMEHVFKASEQEFKTVNARLQTEFELKKASIEKLKQAVNELRPDLGVGNVEDDELFDISNFLSAQIKKRVELEANLSNTLNLLKTLLSNLDAGIIVEDEGRKLLYANQSFCDLFGINMKPEMLTGYNCADMAVASAQYFEDSEFFLENINEIFTNKKEISKQILKLKDGRTMERDFVPMWLESTYVGNLWSYTDITERLKAQEAALKSEQQYRDIIERSSEVIYRTNARGYFTFVNSASERITGYSKQEFLQMHFFDLIKKSKKSEVVRFYRNQVIEGKTSTYYEFPIITKNGQERWIGQTVQFSELNAQNYEFTAFAIDVTERRDYERKILLQDEKYKNIITNMHLGLMEVDNNDIIQFVNQGFCNISGYTQDEIVGKKAAQTLAVGQTKKVLKEKALARQQGISDMYEVQVRTKNGDLKWWLVSGGPNYNNEGKLVGSIGIHLDITENKKLEQELQIQRKKAEDSSKAKESFLANMSHEIRTPLNGIIGMIRELSLEALSDKQQKYVQNASVASQHLLSVLNNILDITKIEAGELKLESTPFSLRETIKDVKSIMTVKAREKGLFFGINVRDIRDNFYLGDSARLRQILLNLIGNAIKFTSRGGVFVECMILETNDNSQKVAITIEDTGVGIEEKYLNNLFNKFSQEDISTSRKYGGTGLGMAITRELVQLMNGSIKVKSLKNEGTTVEVILDLAFAKSEHHLNANEDKSVTDLSNLRVLLVEDNEFNRAVAYNTLKRNKCHITEAKDGLDAVKLVENGLEFDVILMDLQMPIMDGLTAASHLINVKKIDTPIIALSANAFKTEIDACMEMGMKGYVTKPFEESSLINTIARTAKRDVKAVHTPIGNVITPKPSGEKLFDLNKLIEISDGDMEFVKRMVDIFVVESQESVRTIKEAVKARDMMTIYKISHKMKPMIDSLGISSLAKEIRELEQLAKSGLYSAYIDQLTESLATTVSSVIDSIRAHKLTS